MEDSLSRSGKIDGFSSQSIDRNDSGDSVMREFLQSGIEFKWPLHLGTRSGNHCDLRLDIGAIPLTWIKKISDKKASIDIFKAPPEFNFKKHFVVKTLRDSDSQNARTMTAKEVENMRGLRHPHVTALLGTFTYQARLNIMIFPAACCDLQQFMDAMSEATSAPDSTTSNSQQLHSSDVPSIGQRGHDDACNDSWPLDLPIETKSEILRGYFACLSQALKYLHEQGVRHKDIKPANILIDKSLSVILTDFGISRRFPKDESHVTNNEWNFTRKYASPEIMTDRKMPRDDASDVFSLGCVFFEMTTLLLENTLSGLSDHCSSIINESAKDDAYHRNLEKVYVWIDILRTTRGFRPVREHWVPGDNVVPVPQRFPPSADNHLTAALVDVRKMLDKVPRNRPASEMLWQQFKAISPKECRDCDPRSHEMWEPSATQREAAENGLCLRSRQAEEMELENREGDAIREADSTMLSTPNVPRQPSPLSRSLQSPMVEDRITVELRPDSPRSELGSNIEGNATQATMPQPPGLHFPDENFGTTSAQDIQESVRPFFKTATDDTISKTPFGVMSAANAKPLHHLPTQHTATNTLPLPKDSNLREGQAGGTNRRRLKPGENLVRISEKDMPRPETPIIVYDVSQRKAFQTEYNWLKGASEGADRVLYCQIILTLL